MSIVQHLRTLAIESSAPEAVDILDMLHTPTPTRVANNTIDAFVDSLVADGTLNIQDASTLAMEAKSPFTGVAWESIECFEDNDED